MRNLAIYSNAAGQFFSFAREAGEDATADGRSCSVTSNLQLQQLLEWLVQEQSVFDGLIFDTHGDKGFVILGNNEFGLEQLKKFINKGFEKLLTTNAAITFNGCNVAEGAAGERFLLEFGRIFLCAGGGTVKGNTGAGVSFMGTDLGHPTGTWIKVQVGPGGSLRILNPLHLDVGKINDLFRRAETGINLLAQQNTDPKTILRMRALLEDARKIWDKGAPSYDDMVLVCGTLEPLVNDINDLNYAPRINYSAG